jgi:aquaporin NIP
MNNDMVRKSVSEILGTFALVFCGTGAIVIDKETGGAVSHVGVAITFGLIVMAMIYGLGEISGAHLNPAVSIGFALAGRLPVKALGVYIVSQLIGAFLASITLRFLFPADGLLGATLPAGSAWQSFILELILTFILMLVIVNVSTGPKEQGLFAGIAVGSVILLEAMFAGPICGASMNPARSLAPAVVSGHFKSLWVYLIAPVIGAALAIPTWKYLNEKK